MSRLRAAWRAQRWTELAPALLATGCAWVLAAFEPALFQRFFGFLPPALVVPASGLLGFALVAALPAHGFRIGGNDELALGIARAGILASVFGVFITGVDMLVGFPRNINVPLPWGWLYYPVMGFVAEVTLHLLPLTLLLAGFHWLTRHPARGVTLWSCVALASVPESILQVVTGTTDGAAAGLNAIVAVHLLAFGFAELWLLRHHGFLAMYGMRLIYYLWWHILWGVLRTPFLG